MTIFRVGQRVRIVGVQNFPELLNREAAIISDLVQNTSRFSGEVYLGHMIRVDGDERNFCAKPEQLEPITDRPALAEWSECAWSPHRVGVGS